MNDPLIDNLWEGHGIQPKRYPATDAEWNGVFDEAEAQPPHATPADAPGGGAGEPGPGSLVEALEARRNVIAEGRDEYSRESVGYAEFDFGVQMLDEIIKLAAPREARWQADRRRAETAERALAETKSAYDNLFRSCENHKNREERLESTLIEEITRRETAERALADLRAGVQKLVDYMEHDEDFESGDALDNL